MNLNQQVLLSFMFDYFLQIKTMADIVAVPLSDECKFINI